MSRPWGSHGTSSGNWVARSRVRESLFLCPFLPLSSPAVPMRSASSMEGCRESCGKGCGPGFEIDEIPIRTVTNGIHMQSWVAPEMKECYERYLGVDWYSRNFDRYNWDKIDEIPNPVLWQIHQHLKKKMVDSLKQTIACTCERQGNFSPADRGENRASQSRRPLDRIQPTLCHL